MTACFRHKLGSTLVKGTVSYTMPTLRPVTERGQ